jgi:acyl-CoA reductase-like NAD-dependent aldehyde dehydrogenase
VPRIVAQMPFVKNKKLHFLSLSILKSLSTIQFSLISSLVLTLGGLWYQLALQSIQLVLEHACHFLYFLVQLARQSKVKTNEPKHDNRVNNDCSNDNIGIRERTSISTVWSAHKCRRTLLRAINLLDETTTSCQRGALLERARSKGTMISSRRRTRNVQTSKAKGSFCVLGCEFTVRYTGYKIRVPVRPYSIHTIVMASCWYKHGSIPKAASLVEWGIQQRHRRPLFCGSLRPRCFYSSIEQGSIVPMYLCGAPTLSDVTLPVHNKYTGEEFCRVALAEDPALLERGIAAVFHEGHQRMRELLPYQRQAILHNVAQQVRARQDELAFYITLETGKPIRDARAEVDRCVVTFSLAAEETTRIYGEHIDLQNTARSTGYTAVTKRFPIGPICCIAPFNFPLNLVAHKVAPAIAAGCPFVLKPASKTPLSALLLGDILASDSNMPKEAFSILPCSRVAGDILVQDDRFQLLSFTGSAEVGFAIKSRAGKKPVILELGGNAACIIDDFDAVELGTVVDDIVQGAFYQSGQSCISVQRLFVRASLYETFKKALREKVDSLKVGDPFEEDTVIGPLISYESAVRIEAWIEEALHGGATLVCGAGQRCNDVFISPTVVEKVPPHCRLACEEVFGPVVCIEPYSDFTDAVARVNQSKFGLQAGVYTNNWTHAHYAFERIECGGVCINTPPSVRIDAQPYGGIKDSGIGREGVRYTIQDYTELKIMIMKNAGVIH